MATLTPTKNPNRVAMLWMGATRGWGEVHPVSAKRMTSWRKHIEACAKGLVKKGDGIEVWISNTHMMIMRALMQKIIFALKPFKTSLTKRVQCGHQWLCAIHIFGLNIFLAFRCETYIISIATRQSSSKLPHPPPVLGIFQKRIVQHERGKYFNVSSGKKSHRSVVLIGYGYALELQLLDSVEV